MESIGKYYILIYNVLEVHISNIVVVNPKWIVGLFKLGIVNGSFIPSKDICILRKVTRYKLTSVRSSEKNRYQKVLTIGNFKLDMFFLMSSVNPHPILLLLFYQIIYILRKIFFRKFM